MPSVKTVKTRISSVKETRKITNAMYVISSIKMKKIKEELDKSKPYFEALKSEIKHMFNYVEKSEDKYLNSPKGGVNGYLVITADKGLCGAYNKNVIEVFDKTVKEEDMVFMVGEYGRRYCQTHNIEIDKEFNYTAQNPSFVRSKVISNELLGLYNEGKLSNIYIIYTDIKNSMSIEVKIDKLLPLDKEEFAEDLERTNFTIEPSANKVIDQIIPSYISGFIYSALVDSFCSEQSARMMAMDYANKNADKLIDKLKLKYNNLRQGAITQEITEVSAGAKSYNSNK